MALCCTPRWPTTAASITSGKARVRVTTSGTDTDLEPLFRRGRILLLQGVASTLADRLGDALLSRADTTERGAALRDMIDRVRVGAVVDSAGNLEHRSLK